MFFPRIAGKYDVALCNSDRNGVHLLMSHSCIFAATSQVREMKEKCTSVEKLQLFLWPPESVPTDSPSDCQNAQAHCKHFYSLVLFSMDVYFYEPV